MHIHLRHAGLSGIISFCLQRPMYSNFIFVIPVFVLPKLTSRYYFIIYLYVKTSQEVKGSHQVGVPESNVRTSTDLVSAGEVGHSNPLDFCRDLAHCPGTNILLSWKSVHWLNCPALKSSTVPGLSRRCQNAPSDLVPFQSQVHTNLLNQTGPGNRNSFRGWISVSEK